MNPTEKFWNWFNRIISENHLRKYTVPHWITELPCGCKRELPIISTWESRGAQEDFLESRWQIRRRKDGSFHCLQCKKELKPQAIAA